MLSPSATVTVTLGPKFGTALKLLVKLATASDQVPGVRSRP